VTLDTSRGISRPVLVFALSIAGVLITALMWSTVSMGVSWASVQNAQTAQNTKDIAALREEYRVINVKLDALLEMHRYPAREQR